MTRKNLFSMVKQESQEDSSLKSIRSMKARSPQPRRKYSAGSSKSRSESLALVKRDTLIDMFEKKSESVNPAEEAARRRESKRIALRKKVLARGSVPIVKDPRLEKLKDLQKSTQHRSIALANSQKLIKFDLQKMSPMIENNFSSQLEDNHFPNRV